MPVCVKLQAAVYDIHPSLEEGAGKQCSEKESVWVCAYACMCVCMHAHMYVSMGGGEDV